MPFTPFHFGPGMLLKAAAPRRFSFRMFVAANVLIDLEAYYNLTRDEHPIHDHLHTYAGATGVVLVLMAAAHFLNRAKIAGFEKLSFTAVLFGTTLGAYSQIFLDSLMHADMQPLRPFASGNPMLGAVSLEALHAFCVISGVIGLAAYFFLPNRPAKS